jgi:hypothetical protein
MHFVSYVARLGSYDVKAESLLFILICNAIKDIDDQNFCLSGSCIAEFSSWNSRGTVGENRHHYT